MTRTNSDPTRSVPGKDPRAAGLDWQGTARYEVRRCIGAGSMGTVYEAFDRERGQAVALKKLRFFSPATLYLFKQEFRTLADVVHPNLVRLHELVATESRDVFFTMELVRGVDFVAHVQGASGLDPGERIARLRAALRQLVEGVHALHVEGKLHRDIKPSNVLVTPEGRVVLLDFGVATDLSRVEDAGFHDQEPIVGTASYMAPEQASGAAPTPACDWYGVGAILFEALVGSAPFLGSIADVLRLKRTVVPPLASASRGDVPPDLDALCGALLARAPEGRPTGTEILRALGVARRDGFRSPLASLVDSGAPGRLVGRQDQRAALREAFDQVRSGRTLVVQVGGPSGMGKSSLVQEFLDGLASRGEAIILRGRAYERESVPYKAIDSWVDSLSRHLLRLSDRGAQIALPNDVWALARLFPVLRRVPEIAERREELVGDPHRQRRRAFGALRELLSTLTERQPVVVFVDDAHWGDADSAALVLDLVRPPEAPPLLIVMTFLDVAARTSPFLVETAESWPQGVEARQLTVGPLGDDEAWQLAVALLGSDDETTRAVARAMAREAQGSPFLVEELVRDHQATVDRGVSGVVATLEQSIAERLTRLPAAVRRLLETIAVGGRPIDLATVAQAAGLTEGIEDAMALLRTRRFVRVGLRKAREVVETTHERIRDAIVSGLSGEAVRQRHEAIARVLEASPDADPEALTIHLASAGAGQESRAALYAERAAELAIGKFAFDRAVQLFRIALGGAAPGEQTKLRVRLAEALTLAGRGAEAARAFLEAAETLGPEEAARRTELERAAAEQLLGSGRIDEGGEVLRRVLETVGMTVPRSTPAALLWLLVYRIWLAVIGLRFKVREPQEVSNEDRVRIECMYAVGMGFAIVDVVIGAAMQARLLILALRAGDRTQLLRAASLEAAQLAAAGRAPSERERALFAMAEELATLSDESEPRAFVDGARGLALLLRGRWAAARAALDAGTSRTMTRSYWFSNAHLFAVHSLYFSGELKELVRRQTRLVADARDRGDIYTMVNFASTTSITERLMADDPEGARRQLRDATAQWPQKRFFVQHWQTMAFGPDIDLYSGSGGAAYDRVMRDMPALGKSLLRNVQFIRGLTEYTLGRCAVASIAERPATRHARIAVARRASYRLERENMPWTAPLAALLRAASENAAGAPDVAAGALRVAIDRAVANGMAMHATAARYRLGELTGGDAGRALVAEAARAMTAQGIREPVKWVRIYLPGVWTARAAP